MRHHRGRFVRLTVPRRVGLGVVLVLALGACGGSTTGTTNTPAGQPPAATVPGQSPATTVASNSGGYY